MRSLTDTQGSPANALADDRARGLTESLREALGRHAGRLVVLCSFRRRSRCSIDELLRVGGRNAA